MKYQNLRAFQKHLVSSAPAYLCRLYLVAIADDFERSYALGQILAHLPSPSRYSGADCSLADCLDAMQAMSLFGQSVVVLDEVEKLAKKDQQILADRLQDSVGYVLFGTRLKTVIAPVVEREGVVLDLLDEKSWDKEKRLIERLHEKAQAARKQLAPDAAALLVERLGVDSALLESEIEKLICYAGNRSSIIREDVLAISPMSRTLTFWQIAEAVVWEGGEFGEIDSNGFHALIPSLRGQLHLGLTLATLIEEKCPSDQWSRYLPKLWPKILEKRSSQAVRLGAPYFRKGLQKLFELELNSRTLSTQYRAMLDLFRAYLHAR